MWHVFPPQVGQPSLVLWPDVVDGDTRVYGEHFDDSYSDRATAVACVAQTTWRSVGADGFKAIHLYGGLNTTVRLGNRYSVRLRLVRHTGFNGDTFIAGDQRGEVDYVELSVLDDDEPLAVMPLRGGAWWWAADRIALACGYVFTDDGAVLYVNAAALSDRLSLESRVPCFGAGTLQWRHDVDAADTDGELRIEGADIDIVAAAAHRGPFFMHAPYLPDTTETKRARQGTTIGSLRSLANNFDNPMIPVGANDTSYSPETIAFVDAAGHFDVVRPHLLGVGLTRRFLASVPGRVDSETAYIRSDVPWASNVSPVAADNERLARVRVTMAAGKIVPSFTFPFGYVLPSIEWEAASMEANNEYVAYRDTAVTGTGDGDATTRTYVRQNVLVEITRFENMGNQLLAETLDDVTLATVFVVFVQVFIRDTHDTPQTNHLRAVKIIQAVKTLTDGEAADLLAGDAVTFDGFTIQGIGPG